MQRLTAPLKLMAPLLDGINLLICAIVKPFSVMHLTIVAFSASPRHGSVTAGAAMLRLMARKTIAESILKIVLEDLGADDNITQSSKTALSLRFACTGQNTMSL